MTTTYYSTRVGHYYVGTPELRQKATGELSRTFPVYQRTARAMRYVATFADAEEARVYANTLNRP